MGNEMELQHHGILGQKWGVRRFQNKDGTRTPEGKRRERENESSDDKKRFNIDRNTAIKGAIVAGVVTAGAIALANPTTRSMLAKYGKTTMSNLRDVEKAKALGRKVGTQIGRAASEAKKAAFRSVMASVGTIAISKISDKLKTEDSASEFEKNRNKIAKDAVAASIRSVTGGNFSNSGNGNKGGNGLSGDAKEKVVNKVGNPSNKGVDRQSSKWQSLFIDSDGNQRDNETKNLIRSMAKDGYDIDQIDRYLNHSALKEWADSFSFRW